MSGSDDTLTAKEKKLARTNAWRARNREHVRAYNKEWTARNSEHRAAYQQNYMASYQQRDDVQFETWARNLRKNYRMTPEDFNALWDAQDGKCAVCDNALKPRGRTKDAVAVDHNHATGEVRALLCRGCNHGIGQFRDDPKILKAAAEYLTKHGNYSHMHKALKS